MLFRTLLLVITTLQCTNSAKILGVYPMPGTSHYILASKLMKGLSEAGHDVTMISPYKLKEPPKNGKYTDVVLDGLKEDFEALTGQQSLFDMKMGNPIAAIQLMTSFFLEFTNKTLHHPNVKKLLQSDAKFDVVILEQFSNDGLKVFSHIYGCPLIILSSMGPNVWINPMVGNPQPVSYVPHLFVRNFSPDSLLDRAKNIFAHIAEYLGNTYYIRPKHEEIMHKAFPDAPSLYDLWTNVSLILLNSHTSINDAVPVVPNMVEIGGYFIDPPKKLPKDLQDFLDGATDGVIYFSMGSNLKSKDMPDDRKKAILNVFGKLKQKVLWKFEEDLPGQPANVMIRQWCPQQDILAHPNIKLFITHGGLLSTTETIYHGVPILALPVFGDQFANAERAEIGGFGLKMDYHDPNFSEQTFSVLIDELLNNAKYKETAQRRSKIYHDRPHTPMETAVYWVEYVIRHKGAPHLRVAGVRMSWYKYFMVDVIGALIIGLYIALYSIKFVCKKLFCRSNSNKSTKGTKKVKTN